MNNLKEYSDKIGEEVTAVLSRVDPEEMKTFLDLIQGARKIALYGGGREGLMIRALAMRLFHLGFRLSAQNPSISPWVCAILKIKSWGVKRLNGSKTMQVEARAIGVPPTCRVRAFCRICLRGIFRQKTVYDALWI
jgi:hypothetical protein